MIIEDAIWNPPNKERLRGRPLTDGTMALRNLKVGDVKRIEHYDVLCTGTNCSLGYQVSRMRKQGWKLEYYHEKHHVMVVRRLE
jgi:hypothetical protein